MSDTTTDVFAFERCVLREVDVFLRVEADAADRSRSTPTAWRTDTAP